MQLVSSQKGKTVEMLDHLTDLMNEWGQLWREDLVISTRRRIQGKDFPET